MLEKSALETSARPPSPVRVWRSEFAPRNDAPGPLPTRKADRACGARPPTRRVWSASALRGLPRAATPSTSCSRAGTQDLFGIESDVRHFGVRHGHFYMGFGLYISALLLLQTTLLWQLGSLALTDPA